MKVKKEKTTPIPVRFTQRATDRIDRAAGRLSSNRAAVIRLAIEQLLPDIEAGRIILK